MINCCSSTDNFSLIRQRQICLTMRLSFVYFNPVMKTLSFMGFDWFFFVRENRCFLKGKVFFAVVKSFEFALILWKFYVKCPSFTCQNVSPITFNLAKNTFSALKVLVFLGKSVFFLDICGVYDIDFSCLYQVPEGETALSFILNLAWSWWRFFWRERDGGSN